MKIDKKPRHHNMQFTEAERDQLAVFDELIAEATEYHRTIKIRFSSKLNAEKKIETVKCKRNITDYNKFRKAKKKYIKDLELKYGSK